MLTISEWPIGWTWVYITPEGEVVALWPMITLMQNRITIEKILFDWKNLATALTELPENWIITNVQSPPGAWSRCTDCQYAVVMQVGWLFRRGFLACRNPQITRTFTYAGDGVTAIELHQAETSCCPLYQPKPPTNGKRVRLWSLLDILSPSPQTV